MVITGKGYLGLDIWQKTPNQGFSSEDIILTIWYKEAIKQIKINSQQYHLLSFSAKKACYVGYRYFYLKKSFYYPVTDTCFYHELLGPHDGTNSGPN